MVKKVSSSQKKINPKNANSANPQTRLQYYKRRYNRAYSIAIQWWAINQACYHFAIPSRDIFYWSNYTQGAQKNARVYESSAIYATRNFVSKIQNALTPPQQIWCNLVPGTDFEEPSEDDIERQTEYDNIKKELEKITEQVFTYLRRSNFDLAISECYFDLAVGTAALMVVEGETDDCPLKFYSIPCAQLAVEESINGYIDSVYRTYGEVRISEIPLMWPHAKLPDWMINALDNDPNATCKSLNEGVIYMDNEDAYRHVLWADSDLLFEMTTEESPWIVFRWSKINNECFGRGPLQDAIPNILSLNELYRIYLTSANMNISKPYMGWNDGVFSPYLFQLNPNQIIPIAPVQNGQYPIVPLPDVAHPDFAQQVAQDLRNQIYQILYVSPLGNIQDTPTRTATEIAIRQRNLAEEIGPVFTRLQSEFLERLIKRVVNILKKRGLIDAEALTLNGKKIDLEYQSPLVVAQGQLKVQTFLQYQQAMQGVIGPDNAIAMLNPVQVSYWMADQLGVETNLLAPRDKLEDKLSQDAQAQQLAQVQSLASQAGLPGAATI